MEILTIAVAPLPNTRGFLLLPLLLLPVLSMLETSSVIVHGTSSEW